ncbi:uncharacterized protein B0I36DRAFT_254585 [Microdochium trichocladiopsis]|uniref:Uncharacterized protein n=1 Tax=Microdochium trichocladiopsis TaxID=1682393 RepID=A0A9P9BJA7_9PEZI|nr:uncharacterized protein B0I36DRAFT_254585 [Microdochium trichocladiopsis]KAH7016538.1 hypothetical protein B0I36DRAFT_254585 [Microdochium trichocladiopsis]
MTFAETNSRLDQERRAKFCGVASIRVNALCFAGPRWTTELAPERRILEPFKRKFREEKGFRADEHRHHAKAIISPELLDSCLRNANIEAQRLREETEPHVELELPPNTQLQCLQQGEKALAACEAFDGAQTRWIVDLYLEDLSDDLRRLFLEEHDYREAPSDGEFYRKIREYQGVHGQKNQYFERLWLGQLSALSKNRRNLFEQLSRNKAFLEAFDDLLIVPALFSGFRLTVIHQMMSLRCEEPIIAYLRCIGQTWRTICGDDKNKMEKIDADTIRALQGMAPGACQSDHSSLLDKLRSGHILGGFTEQARGEMWSQICTVSRHTLIPSLHTFFEDLKYLKCATDSLRRLLHLGPRDTIDGCLESMLTDGSANQHQCIIQFSDSEYKLLPGHAATRFALGCRQLWLAAFRIYQDLPAEPQKAHIRAKPRKKGDEVTLFRLADLASRLGFTSEPIRNILQHSPSRQVARTALLAVIKPGRYMYKNLEGVVDQITGVFESAELVPLSEASSSTQTSGQNEGPIRWGLPHNIDHERDRESLFLPNLHAELMSPFPLMTSIFVRRSVYFAFFGRELPPGVQLDNLLTATDLTDTIMAEIVPRAERSESEDTAGQEGQTKLNKLNKTGQSKLDTLDEVIKELKKRQAELSKLDTSVEERHAEIRGLDKKLKRQVRHLLSLQQQIKVKERSYVWGKGKLRLVDGTQAMSETSSAGTTVQRKNQDQNSSNTSGTGVRDGFPRRSPQRSRPVEIRQHKSQHLRKRQRMSDFDAET